MHWPTKCSAWPKLLTPYCKNLYLDNNIEWIALPQLYPYCRCSFLGNICQNIDFLDRHHHVLRADDCQSRLLVSKEQTYIKKKRSYCNIFAYPTKFTSRIYFNNSRSIHAKSVATVVTFVICTLITSQTEYVDRKTNFYE